jgi:Glucodextranase, domain B/Carboxypeptidase regulatory-like domain
MNARNPLLVLFLLLGTLPAAAHVTVFGPKVYNAAKGAPQTVSETIALAGPCDLTPNAVYTLVVKNDGVSSASIRINGTEVVAERDFNQQATTIERNVTLAAANTLAATIKGGSRDGTLTVSIRRHIETGSVDTAGPVVTLSGLRDGDLVGANPLAVSGVVSDASGVSSLSINGAVVTIGASGAFAAQVQLVEGPNTLVFDATDCEGNASRLIVNVVFDIGPPRVTVTSRLYTNVTTFAVAGTATAYNGLASVTANGTAMTISGSSWSGTLSMPGDDGPRAVEIVATDNAGRRTVVPVTVTIDRVPPQITAIADPPPNEFGWFAGAAHVRFHCTDASPVACAPRQQVEVPGTHTVTGTAEDAAGNSASASIVVKVDVGAPEIVIDPVGSALEIPTVSTSTLMLTGTIADDLSGARSVTCNDGPGTISGSSFSCNVALQPGINQINVLAYDRAGHERRRATTVTLDAEGPSVHFGTPAEPGAVVEGAELEVVVYASDASDVAGATINGVAATGSRGRFTRRISLTEGTNQITATVTDRIGNTRSAATTVQRITPVRIEISEPADLATVNVPAITVRGTVAPPAASVSVNDVPASVSGGIFTALVPLAQGRTVVTATATAPSGVASANVNIYRDSIRPRVVVYAPADGATVRQTPIAVSGMVDDIVVGTINSEQLTVTVNGVAAAVKNRAFLATGVPLTAGLNTLTIIATDRAGNAAEVTSKVTLATAAGRKLTIVSGNAQTAAIGAALPQPLAVRLADAADRGIGGEKVTFTVVQNNGSLTAGGVTDRVVEVTTNNNGNASVNWTLGTRAGAGNQRVLASAPDAAPVELTATGNTGPARLIVVDSGNGQFGLAGQKLPRPLLAIVVDAGSNRVAGVPVTFRVTAGGGTINGQTAVTVNTDSDGRAWVTPTLGPEEGNDNNFIEASVAGVSQRATFVASGRIGGPPSATSISGTVVDNMNNPVPGVTLRVDDTTLSAQANAQGRFVIANVPVGYLKLIVDGSTAQRQGTWPTLEFVMYTLPGIDNNLGMPIYMLPIDVQRGIQVTETTGGTLTFPELPGFSLTVEKGSALFPNGSRAGTVSATLVHPDKMPMPPAFGQQPRFIVTIQPVGVHFDPPAKITFPNLDGLAPGEVTELYSFDHDLGQFVSIGTGSVSADGSVLVSDPGVGIVKGGWHGGGNPNPTGNTSAVNVQISAPTRAVVGEVVEVTASGTPANGGHYFNWVVLDDPSDPADSAGTAQFITQPSCPGQPTCVAQLRILAGGRATVQVSFQTTATATATGNSQVVTQAVQATSSQTQKIVVPAIELDSVIFQMAHSVCEDRPGGAVPLPPTQWVRQPNPSPQGTEGDPVVYTRSLPNDQRKIKAQLRFKVNGILTQSIPGVTIRGQGGGFTFEGTTPLTIPAGADSTDVVNVESVEFLPDKTRYDERMVIEWSYALPGTTEFCSAGRSINDFHVLLGKPKNVVYRTLLKLGESNGQTTEAAVVSTIWNRFAGPADVKTWNNRPLYYYADNVDTFACAVTSARALMTNENSCGQCGGWTRLLQTSLGLHGIDSKFVGIGAKPPAQQMLVRNFRFSDDLDDDHNAPPAFAGDADGYVYRLLRNPNDVKTVGPLNVWFEDVKSVEGVKGQGVGQATPFEKIFNAHFFLVPIIDGNEVMPWLDPSYGITYSGVADFQNKAIAGVAQGTGTTVSLSNVLHPASKAKKITPGSLLVVETIPAFYPNND